VRISTKIGNAPIAVTGVADSLEVRFKGPTPTSWGVLKCDASKHLKKEGLPLSLIEADWRLWNLDGLDYKIIYRRVAICSSGCSDGSADIFGG
jgi:hypothetical protein